MVESEPPSAPPAQRRAPFGLAAVAVALLASLPVLAFDRLEGVLGDLMPEGLQVLLVIVTVFAAVWFVGGSAILALASPRPDREGLLAGGLVALLMLAILVWEADIPWVIVLLVWVLFGGLAVGCGAVAGLIGLAAQRGSRRGDQGTATAAGPVRGGGGGRAAAVAAIACAAAIAVAGLFFMGPPSGRPGAFLFAVVALLGGAGAWGLARSRRRPRPTDPR